MNHVVLCFLFLLLPALPASATALANVDQWNFRVYLDNKPIGEHRFVARHNGSEREVTVDARFDVKLLFVTAYRYVHRANESWRGNCLSRLEARTDDNGRALNVRAEKRHGQLHLLSPHNQAMSESCVMSFAYWNPEILAQTRLLNPQTGHYEAVNITAFGEEDLMVRGVMQRASRYRIQGSRHPIDVWYGPGGTWVALQSRLDGGRTLRYELL